MSVEDKIDRARQRVVMDLNEYQKKALATRIYPSSFKVIYPIMKLNGEAGETIEKVAKLIRDKNYPFDPITEEDRIAIAKELGDCLWYIAALADDLDFSLLDIAIMNLEKLLNRKQKGKISGSGDDR